MLRRNRSCLDEVRAAMKELRAATLARQKAEADLRDLYRERAIAEGSRVLS